LRTKLQDEFIGIKGILYVTVLSKLLLLISLDIYGSLDARRGDLEPIIRSMIGRPSRVLLSVICSTENGDRIAELPLEVRSCSTSPKGLWKSLGKVKGIYLTCDSVYDQRYVAVPSSLPSIDEIDKFGRKILSLLDESHSEEITRRLDAFLLFYCRQEHPSPLISNYFPFLDGTNQQQRRFSDSTLWVVGLNGLVSYGYLNLQDGSYKLLRRPSTRDSEGRNFVSPTVYDQIRLLAAEGVKPIVESVFAEADRLNKLIGSSSMLV
jgi:hypothetical protein